MARVPAAELERLKRDISIEQLARARGIVLKPASEVGRGSGLEL